MRLFVAAELPESIIEALAETSAGLRATVPGRYVASDLFHITLAFLGEVAGQRADYAATALDEACREAVSFEVALGDLGSFGRRRKATVWQGLSDAGALPELAKSVRRELRDRDFDFNEKAFLPHVTLMRAADLSSGCLPAPCIARGQIEQVTLFRSNLSGQRPRYESIHSVLLAGSEWG